MITAESAESSSQGASDPVDAALSTGVGAL